MFTPSKPNNQYLAVNIDLTEVIEASVLKEEDYEKLSLSITEKIRVAFLNKWNNEIDKVLHSTRAEYKKGMFFERLDNSTIELGITARQSKLALAIEEGRSAFDIKEGFEKSTKRTMKQDGGWFLTIPYRHATPGALAEASVFSNKMTKEVYNLAKKADSPLKKAELPGKFSQVGAREEIKSNNRVFQRYEHKSPIHEGLVKGKGKYHGQYTTFRRVSDKSDPMSWIHPGFESRDLIGKVYNSLDIGSIVALAKDEFLGLI